MTFEKALLRVCFMFFAVLVTGCGPVYNTTYSYQAPSKIQGKQCIIQCQQAKTLCQSACSTTNYQCRALAMDRAHAEYRAYEHRMRREKKPITRDVNYYYNSFGCNASCGCATQFNDCYTMCGGEVLVHKKCVAFCGKKN